MYRWMDEGLFRMNDVCWNYLALLCGMFSSTPPSLSTCWNWPFKMRKHTVFCSGVKDPKDKSSFDDNTTYWTALYDGSDNDDDDVVVVSYVLVFGMRLRIAFCKSASSGKLGKCICKARNLDHTDGVQFGSWTSHVASSRLHFAPLRNDAHSAPYFEVNC